MCGGPCAHDAYQEENDLFSQHPDQDDDVKQKIMATKIIIIMINDLKERREWTKDCYPNWIRENDGCCYEEKNNETAREKETYNNRFIVFLETINSKNFQDDQDNNTSTVIDLKQNVI